MNCSATPQSAHNRPRGGSAGDRIGSKGNDGSVRRDRRCGRAGCQRRRRAILRPTGQAHVPGAAPVQLQGVEIVDTGGNVGFIAFPDPPPHPPQRLEGESAQGVVNRERIIGFRQVLLLEIILHAQAGIHRKAGDERCAAGNGPEQTMHRIVKRHKCLRHLDLNELKAYHDPGVGAPVRIKWPTGGIQDHLREPAWSLRVAQVEPQGSLGVATGEPRGGLRVASGWLPVGYHIAPG
jgi:hypothetical protein